MVKLHLTTFKSHDATQATAETFNLDAVGSRTTALSQPTSEQGRVVGPGKDREQGLCDSHRGAQAGMG